MSPFFVAVDHGKRSVVISIRGTLSLQVCIVLLVVLIAKDIKFIIRCHDEDLLLSFWFQSLWRTLYEIFVDMSPKARDFVFRIFSPKVKEFKCSCRDLHCAEVFQNVDNILYDKLLLVLWRGTSRGFGSRCREIDFVDPECIAF